jgi:hypothetical protein
VSGFVAAKERTDRKMQRRHLLSAGEKKRELAESLWAKPFLEKKAAIIRAVESCGFDCPALCSPEELGEMNNV